MKNGVANANFFNDLSMLNPNQTQQDIHGMKEFTQHGSNQGAGGPMKLSNNRRVSVHQIMQGGGSNQ